MFKRIVSSKAFKVVGIAFLAICLVLTIWKQWADAHFYDDYDPALPLNAHVVSDEDVDVVKESYGMELPRRYRRIEFTYEARTNDVVPALLTLPRQHEAGKLPLVIFVHGSHQQKESIEKFCTAFNEEGFAMASFDQLMRGVREVPGKAAMVLAWRERSWKTVNDTRRLMDYLVTRPEIDEDRIYLVGASYGAITGTPLVAQDRRIKAADLVVGGGNISNLVNSPAVNEVLPPYLRNLAKPLIGFLMKPAEPTRHAALLSPTPVLMQNGDQDTVVTPESGQALYDALKDPKEIRWYGCDHPSVRDEDNDVVLQILAEGLAWIKEQDGQRG